MNRSRERPVERLEESGVVPIESHTVPIEDHSVLSDQRSAALVTPNARITWLCVPRIDSPAIFAELLDCPEAGRFSIEPLGDSAGTRPTQAYVGNTLVLQTSWPTLCVTDYLDCSDGQPHETTGRTRLIRHIEGTGQARVVFAPRLDFGRLQTQIKIRDGGLEVADAADLLVLESAGVDWSIEDHGVHQTAAAEIDLDQGPVTLEMLYGATSPGAIRPPELERREQTARYWSDWGGQLQIPDVEPESVLRSALTLKALCYGPTGAILAAATTSLPEFIGGVRNWDYRYCWIRDAAMSASALTRLGSTTEAVDLLDWLLAVIATNDVNPDQLSPLYTVEGQALPPEETIEEFAGYADSRPVRVGNAACRQLQLDVFGSVAELIHQVVSADGALPIKYWRLLEDLVEAVGQRWMEPDQGMWEIRSAPRHHTHSKVMCWLTVDRAVATGAHVGDGGRAHWIELRERIRDDVLANGWSDQVGAFTTAYDGTDLDASVLAIGLFGLIEPDDPRFAATVAAVEKSLRHNETLYRYKHEDGISGAEGGFNLMTSWLIDAKIAIGDLDEARALFESYIALAGPTGLIPEEVDPITRQGLGNHPQAYSHLGLINNACNLAQAGTTAGHPSKDL